MQLKTCVTYTLSYEDIFNPNSTEHIISNDLKLDSVKTCFTEIPSPANKVKITRIVNLYGNIQGDWKQITATPTDSFSFYVSDKLPTLENITNALNKESEKRQSDVTINWRYIEELPQQTKKIVVADIYIIVRHLDVMEQQYNGKFYKKFDERGFLCSKPLYNSTVYVRKLNKKDIIINTKGHEIWPQKTGNIPSELARLFKKNQELLEFVQDDVRTK